MSPIESDDLEGWAMDSERTNSARENTKDNTENQFDTDYVVEKVKDIPSNVKEDVFNFAGSLRYQMEKGLKHIFTRDLVFNWFDVVMMIFHALITSGIATFLVVSLTSDGGATAVYDFTSAQEVTIFSLIGIGLLVSGIFVDKFITNKYYYEILLGVSITCIIIISSFPTPNLSFISAIILAFTTTMLITSLFVLIVSKTTMLSRGRFVAFVMFFMMLFIIPVGIGLSSLDSYRWLWLVILGLAVGLEAFSQKFKEARQLRIAQSEQLKINRQDSNEDNVRFSLADLWRMIKKSQILPYLSFMFLIGMALGFFLNNVIDKSTDLNHQMWVAIIVGVISFPTIGILMDNAGRKPIAIMAALSTGIIAIFSDYPTINLEAQTEGLLADFKMGIFVFGALVLMIFTVVIAGDKSSIFSRGRTMSLFLFATIGGTILGIYLEIEIFPQELREYHYIQMADWGSAIIFLAVVAFSTASESFDFRTTFWRQFLDKLYLLTDSGTSIYSYNFSKYIGDGNVNEDLVSGGLTGIQSMLKEISHSNKKIRVLDHGDLKILFHHGDKTTAILFVKEELYVFREKLARFHNVFEYINKDALEVFKGNISSLESVDDLRRKYFE